MRYKLKTAKVVQVAATLDDLFLEESGNNSSDNNTKTDNNEMSDTD